MKRVVNELAGVLSVLLLVVGLSASVAWAAGPDEELENSDDPNRVIISINGDELTAAELDVLLEYRIGRDPYKAVTFWREARLKAGQARYEGLHLDPDVKFLLDSYENYHLAHIFDRKVATEMPSITPEERRAYYEEKKDELYKVPYRVELKHIRVSDESKAEFVADLARKPGADFDQLVEEYTEDEDKIRKGFVRVIDIQLAHIFSDEFADAVLQSQPGDVIGPFLCKEGFEVARIVEVFPSHYRPFEEVDESIERKLKAEKIENKREALMEAMEVGADIYESEEYKRIVELFKEDEQRRPY